MTEETIVETKTCRQCSASFDITNNDLEFYDKISPVFNGTRYSMSSPTLCPDCRKQRRLAWRNERSLYRRKCDLTGKDIISIYSSDKPYKIYNKDDWWSDKWDPKDYGKEFDFSKSFFEQFDTLLKDVPLLSLTASFESENSEYQTFSGKMKDCYMLTGSWACEKSMYSTKIINADQVVDALDGTNLELCYETVNCESCFSSFYCVNSNNCSNSFFLYDCENCSDCFGCYNLKGKKYHIDNIEYSKEEYFKILDNLKEENFKDHWEKMNQIKLKAINKNLMIINSLNSIGDHIKNCKNCIQVFSFEESSDCKYCENGLTCSNVYDTYGAGENFELGYELLDTGINVSLTCFGITCYSCSSSFYNINCHNCSDIFGCVGLRNSSYCILNKQYSKEEYEQLVPKIIENMKSTGEWGEFFPASISPFGYNETIANEHFPIDKKQSKGIFKWSSYEQELPQISRIINASKLPESIIDIPDDIINWAIECEVTGKPFRIIKQELDFYRKHSLPIPRRHPDQRHLDRLKLRNPRKLFDRNCDKCGASIKTTYSPDKEDIVYCESCYDKEVY